MTRNGLENNGPKSVSSPSSRFRLWVPSRTCQTCRALLLFAGSRGFSTLENTQTHLKCYKLYISLIYVCAMCTARNNQLIAFFSHSIIFPFARVTYAQKIIIFIFVIHVYSDCDQRKCWMFCLQILSYYSIQYKNKQTIVNYYNFSIYFNRFIVVRIRRIYTLSHVNSANLVCEDITFFIIDELISAQTSIYKNQWYKQNTYKCVGTYT